MHEPPIILIIDDDPQVVKLFGQKLTGAGFEVKEAFSGKDGYETAKVEKPDLIILDLRMPVWDGIETLSQLKKDAETKDLKVIVVSSWNDWWTMKVSKEDFKTMGALDFIDKSIDLDKLVLTCRSIINEPH
ncbi:MAG: response regulator [bacterium]|nr:response regulator [bacterium]